MNRVVLITIGLSLLFIAGCGGGLIKAKGRVVSNGSPFTPGPGERLQISLYPVMEDEKKPPPESYPASVNPSDSTFEVRGKTGKGIPAGHYRVGVKVAYGRDDKDRLKGAFGWMNSPIKQEIRRSSDEVVVDIGQPKP